MRRANVHSLLLSTRSIIELEKSAGCKKESLERERETEKEKCEIELEVRARAREREL